MQIINLIDWILLILTTLFCALFLFSSIREKERRATFLAFICLAVSAGLGTLGRMGIFMHPVHGPCVRLSVVTTELELIPTLVNKHTAAIEAFCAGCKKCADNCPSQSIANGEEPVSRGFRHWSIHQEKCFSYWKTIGTDCGFCIRVCPYTKPDTLVHRLVRFYISRNPFNQRLALFLDDLFYGRRLPIAS